MSVNAQMEFLFSGSECETLSCKAAQKRKFSNNSILEHCLHTYCIVYDCLILDY